MPGLRHEFCARRLLRPCVTSLLRGPQGTLFGSGSVGGTIRYITNRPRLGRVEGLVEGKLNLVAEEEIGGHLKGAINVPLGDTAAIRAVGYYTQYGGFVDALREVGGREDNGERDVLERALTGGSSMNGR